MDVHSLPLAGAGRRAPIWYQEVAKVGEPWAFGLHPADVPGYLAERGLDLKGDLSAKDAATRYGRDEPAAEYCRIAWAEVRWMPRASEEHLANRKQQILDAAANCFARNGFHRTSMQDIVRESGLSAGLIYRYFTGKDDMIVAIVEERHVQRAASLAATDLTTGYLDLLRRIASQDAAQERNLSMQAWAETVRDPRGRELAGQGVDGPAKAGLSPPAVPLQSSWDDTLGVEAFVDSVRALLQRDA